MNITNVTLNVSVATWIYTENYTENTRGLNVSRCQEWIYKLVNEVKRSPFNCHE